MSDEARMRMDKVFTDKVWHPPRRRVKFVPVTRVRDPDGNQVIVDNSAWIGEYPILWSRRVGDGERIVTMLVDASTGQCATGRLPEEDFEKLPETEIEW